ncbi:MAG: hypothetical protein DRN66_01015 [Candidatus Nanohalarchaeota archaeon]|nr:MAG: hypothetical protein DRN66_01015 [Candidatus Nanohaloarchaeota archaeon]
MTIEESCKFFCHLLKNNKQIADKNQAELKKHADHQSPKIAIITCSDSRMPLNLYGEVNDIMGNVFVGKDIGNTSADSDAVIDYAINHLKIPLIVILGHTDCGAVKAAADDFSDETPAIKKRLETIKNSSKDTTDAAVDKHIQCVKDNVHDSVERIINAHRNLIDNKELSVAGCLCDTAGIYGQKICSATYIININGGKDSQELQNQDLIKTIDDGLKSRIFSQ